MVIFEVGGRHTLRDGEDDLIERRAHL